MAGRKEKSAPKIHPKFDVQREEPVNTNLATSYPTEGTLYAGTYLQYKVLYRVDGVGRKVIIEPSSLLGVVMP